MRHFIVMTIAILAVGLEPDAITGFNTWDRFIKVCHNKYMDLFCVANFNRTILKAKLDEMPINRVQRALVQDECCSKYCTVRDIYNKYCLNKNVTIVAVDVVPKRKRKNRTTTTTTAAAIISTIAATTTTPTPRATDSAATTLRTVTTATCYGLLLFFVASRWPMFVAR